MKHQLKQIFHSPKFVVGFVIFVVMLSAAIFYPLISSVSPLQSIAKANFIPPGRYINVQDAVESTNKVLMELDVVSERVSAALSASDKEKMIVWLEEYGGVEAGTLSADNIEELLEAWYAKYDPNTRFEGMLTSTSKEYQRMNTRVSNVLSQNGVIIAEMVDGELVKSSTTVRSQDFVGVKDIPNQFYFPLGTDNFGRDVLTQMTSAIGTSLRLGLVAGLVATAIGLTLGLLAGYVGGIIDNVITFITNLFTVIPGFVLLILISYSISQTTRGVNVVAVVIGLTAWPWTCRSVRSQVISLRNRDHVNLSKLSGHSLVHVVVFDVLPYIASYVVMALILQISSAILAEAQLSMLGLGPSTTKVATLGLMMNWAQTSSAWQLGAWWAFLPVIASIALVSFSLNLMNTGLDQVFNPQLRDS